MHLLGMLPASDSWLPTETTAPLFPPGQGKGLVQLPGLLGSDTRTAHNGDNYNSTHTVRVRTVTPRQRVIGKSKGLNTDYITAMWFILCI